MQGCSKGLVFCVVCLEQRSFSEEDLVETLFSPHFGVLSLSASSGKQPSSRETTLHDALRFGHHELLPHSMRVFLAGCLNFISIFLPPNGIKNLSKKTVADATHDDNSLDMSLGASPNPLQAADIPYCAALYKTEYLTKATSTRTHQNKH